MSITHYALSLENQGEMRKSDCGATYSQSRGVAHFYHLKQVRFDILVAGVSAVLWIFVFLTK